MIAERGTRNAESLHSPIRNPHSPHHPCPVPACAAAVPNARLFCPRCWALVPARVRKAVADAWAAVQMADRLDKPTALRLQRRRDYELQRGHAIAWAERKTLTHQPSTIPHQPSTLNHSR